MGKRTPLRCKLTTWALTQLSLRHSFSGQCRKLTPIFCCTLKNKERTSMLKHTALSDYFNSLGYRELNWYIIDFLSSFRSCEESGVGKGRGCIWELVIVNVFHSPSGWHRACLMQTTLLKSLLFQEIQNCHSGFSWLLLPLLNGAASYAAQKEQPATEPPAPAWEQFPYTLRLISKLAE